MNFDDNFLSFLKSHNVLSKEIQDLILNLYEHGGHVQLVTASDDEREYQHFIGKLAHYYSFMQKVSYNKELLIEIEIEYLNIFGSGSSIGNSVGNQMLNVPTIGLNEKGWEFAEKLIEYRKSLLPSPTIEEVVEQSGDLRLWKWFGELFKGIFSMIIKALKFLRWFLLIMSTSLALFFAADASPRGQKIIDSLVQMSYCKKLLELL